MHLMERWPVRKREIDEQKNKDIGKKGGRDRKTNVEQSRGKDRKRGGDRRRGGEWKRGGEWTADTDRWTGGERGGGTGGQRKEEMEDIQKERHEANYREDDLHQWLPPKKCKSSSLVNHFNLCYVLFTMHV